MASPSRAETSSRPIIPELESIYASTVAGGILLAAVSWTALIWLIFNELPTVPNRWLFFLLFQIGLSGTAVPFVRFLHRRFDKPGDPPLNVEVLIRQSVLVGLFGTICLWLRIPRLLSLLVALVVLVALVMVESLLRLRERTAWRPE
jgi:hypothetical protein